MYQVVLLFAFLAFSAGAPLGDANWQQPSSGWENKNFAQQQIKTDNFKQEDDSQLVDSLGGGYSFFKKQPIVARPVIQQKLAINDQQGPISSFADTSNQWSDYTKASAFKHQPKVHVVVANKDLVKDQGAYGSEVAGDQTLIKNTVDLTSQQDFQKSWMAKSNGGYGQQEVRTLVQQQPLIRDSVSSYGQQDLQKSWTPKSNEGYGQQEVRTLIQQQPLIRDSVSSYGQQDLQKSWTPKSNEGYGQQEVRTLIQQQPLIRDSVSSYGQQDLQKSWTPKAKTVFVQHDLQQPWAPKSTGGYGQQEVRTLVQQQPLIRDSVSSYGQQDLQKSWAPKSNEGYGQQDIRTLVQQQPLIRDSVSSYGQQDLQKSWTPKAKTVFVQQDLQQPWAPKSTESYGQQDIRTLVQHQPLIRDSVSSYGQQDLQKSWTPKSNSGYGQQVESTFDESMDQRDLSQNIQQKLSVPMMNGASNTQFGQSSWSSQQTDIPQERSSMISSRTFSQPQTVVQKSSSGSFAGW